MRVNLRQIAAGLVLLAIGGASLSRPLGQQTSPPRTRPPAIIKYSGDMALMLEHLTWTFGVTIGLEVHPQQPNSLVTLDLRDPTLSDAMNAIVKSASRYRWREGDGFIEMSPLEGGSPLLDTIISNFRVKDVDQAEAINQLMNLPEVKTGIRAMNLNRRVLASASTDKKGEKFSISLEGVTMRQALGRIAAESGGRFWIFRKYGDGSFSISSSPSPGS